MSAVVLSVVGFVALLAAGLFVARRRRLKARALRALRPHPTAEKRGGCRVCGKRSVRHVVTSNRGIEGHVCGAWCGQRLVKRLKEAAQ